MHKKGHAAARTKSPAHLKPPGIRDGSLDAVRKWEEELDCMERIIAWLEEGKELLKRPKTQHKRLLSSRSV